MVSCTRCLSPLAGELARQRVADLLRAPVQLQLVLHEIAQRLVMGQFSRSGPRPPCQRHAVRGERPVITRLAAVAADLPADRGRATPQPGGDGAPNARQAAGRRSTPARPRTRTAPRSPPAELRSAGNAGPNAAIDHRPAVPPPHTRRRMHTDLSARSIVAHPLRHQPKITLPLRRQRGTRTRPRTILRYRHCNSLNGKVLQRPLEPKSNYLA